MSWLDDQLEFKSLDFKGRELLRVAEVAEKWMVTEQHVVDLLEEGKLVGFDIAGRHEYVRVPMAAIKIFAEAMQTTPEALLEIIRKTRPPKRSGRAHWRIPVKEGYQAFMKENHSLSERK